MVFPRKLLLSMALMLLLANVLASCDRDSSGGEPSAPSGEVKTAATGRVDFPGNMEGAKALLSQFLDPNLDRAALTQKLRPTAQDYQAVFVKDSVKVAYRGYETPWNEGKIVVRNRPGQSELKIWAATTEQLQKNKGDAGAFPGGYQIAAPYFRPGITFYRFKFVAPGEDLGFAWDGLVYVNGHWVIFPKPWRVVPVKK